jgi:flavin reductase (DIM6/NTAB) family NADH-FMN oxidoreductase RutF
VLTGGYHEIRLTGWRRAAFRVVRIPAVAHTLAWFDCSVPGTRGRLGKVFEPYRWKQG